MSDILVLKLVTGEEIICSVEESSDNYDIICPLRLVQYENGATGFSPFMDSADFSTYTRIRKSHVVLAAPAITDFSEKYEELADAILNPKDEEKIQTPPKKGIIT